MVRATKIREERTRSRQGGQLALLVLCGAMFLDSLDVSLIGVALPSIEQDLALTPATLQWLISGYTVAYGGFLLLGGRTADLFGRRRVFLAAMVLFAVASLVGGLVTDGTLLMLTRVLKGIAAAFTAPAALSIITTTFPEGPERNRALGVYAATAASGYSLGLVLSGMLTQLHWRLVFLLPAVIATLVVVLAVRVLRGDEAARPRDRGYDPLGAITVTAGLLLLVYGLTEAPESGWGSVSTIGTLAVAAALLVAFLVIESRHPDPGVPLRIFASRTLSTANVLGVIFLAASIGWQFIATLYLQRTLEYSPLQTALAFLPLGIMVFLGGGVRHRAADVPGRHPHRGQCRVPAPVRGHRVVRLRRHLHRLRLAAAAGGGAARHRQRADLPRGEHRRSERRARQRAGTRLRADHGLHPDRRRYRRRRRHRRQHRRHPAGRLPVRLRRRGRDLGARRRRGGTRARPGSPAGQRREEHTGMSESTRNVAQGWFTALTSGDIATAQTYLSPDVEFINYKIVPGYNDDMAWIGTYHGRDAAVASFKVFIEVCEPRLEELVALAVDGDEAFGVIHEISAVRENGQEFEIEFIQRLTIRDGLIVRWKSYTDPSPIIRAIRGENGAP
jgi:MFS family permease/ketosteroid isomerase-like protein